ncbi:adaptin [Acrasis kona]|uniref:Adaptin n=1 Tax=Acrasis kona TaxID=1008807 RepID=A0AAW2ZHD8_9EUKA
MSLLNDEYEEVLCQIKECHVFRIPPRQTAEGYKAESWTDHHLWTGKCKVVARGEKCEVRLEEANSGKIFAVCPINTKGGPQAVEKVTDSSRYFVLRIEDPVTKKHAFIGIGFAERGDAFDFNVALQDHQKQVTRAHQPIEQSNEPAKDYSLGDEKISVKINVKTKGKVSSSTGSSQTSGFGDNQSGGGFASFLPAPPTATNRRVPLGNQPQQQSSKPTNNGFSDDFQF